MKTRNFLISGLLGIVVAGLVITGCHKEGPLTSNTTDTSNDPSMYAAQDNANGTFAVNDAKAIADAAMQSRGYSYNVPESHHRRWNIENYGPCVTLTGGDTVIGVNTDTIVYINFSNHDCQGDDGRNRRGTIIVYWGLMHPGETLLQAYSDSGNTITMTFRDFFLRGREIGGVITSTDEGHDTAGFQNWNFTANLTIMYSNQDEDEDNNDHNNHNNNDTAHRVATWVSSRNSQLVTVNNVMYYESTGSGTGVTKDSAVYSVVITSPVYMTVAPWWMGGCPWPEAGIITITRTWHNNTRTSTVNYGSLGNCSPQKQIIIGGNNFTFAMW